MIKNGGKGNSTVTGILYEEKVDILNSLDTVEGYSIKNKSEIFYDGEKIASAYPKSKLYSEFLNEKGVKYKSRIGRKILPDQAIFIESTETMNIIEVKKQTVAGSVDEKITTCHFKKQQYEKLLDGLVSKVEFIYCLSPYFDDVRYNDELSYINEVGCQYYFEEIPLNALELPDNSR
ncbi:hypothetical protein PJK55_06420 [Exiguobacterium sp. MMG028]|uniref:hypothetical protein n=1 Tax=Exiguobacterium sp. MMG028 TaxID=3021979 RepID=UPI0022FF005A|nr:hypothetical protein [Exiguobacterium sp. MMG028]MDA5560367.1 hypothetical protein [Exiguobacterium sp. MMG028]